MGHLPKKNTIALEKMKTATETAQPNLDLGLKKKTLSVMENNRMNANQKSLGNDKLW
jgi:hypothetical protein